MLVHIVAVERVLLVEIEGLPKFRNHLGENIPVFPKHRKGIRRGQRFPYFHPNAFRRNLPKQVFLLVNGTAGVRLNLVSQLRRKTHAP